MVNKLLVGLVLALALNLLFMINSAVPGSLPRMTTAAADLLIDFVEWICTLTRSYQRWIIETSFELRTTVYHVVYRLTTSEAISLHILIGVIVSAVFGTMIRLSTSNIPPGFREFFKTVIGDRIYSLLISEFSSDLMPDLRSVFRNALSDADVKVSENKNHSHSTAANNRKKAWAYMEHITNLMGLKPYHHGLSKNQQKLLLSGFKNINIAKDLQQRIQADQMDRNSILCLTDSDYNIDMPNVMDGQPILLYTFVPEKVAGSVNDGIYCIHPDDSVDITINGGGHYRERLWDYETDHLLIDGWFFSYLYLVEQIRVDESHRLIFLNPVRRSIGPLTWLLPGRRLTRRKFCDDGVAYNKYTRVVDGKTTVWHSIAQAGEYVSCEIISDAWSAAYIRLFENKDPYMSDVERYFNAYKVENPLLAASLFYHIFKSNRRLFELQASISTPGVDRHTYQTTDTLVTETGRPSMRALWPGYDTAFSPAKSFNNDNACLKGRIIDVKNKRPPLPPVFFRYMTEFVTRLVPDDKVNTLAPASYERVWEQFDRPTQRRKLKPADFNFDPKVTVSSFQKREAYAKVTAPRNISTLPMGHNAKLAQYTIPFLDNIMKKAHWYAFGKHPKVFSQLLHQKAQNKLWATSSDFNKLDGSIRGFFRDLMVAVMVRAYSPQYHDELRNIENNERHAKCYTSHGVKYDSDSTILSGSSDTSILGTLTNSFIMYTAYRSTLDADDSWNSLGLYGGDDGVSFDLPPEHVQRTAAKFGMACDAERSEPGMPVKFLGRIYIDPWTTDQSIADVARQMRKIHLTSAPTVVPDWMVLYRKATGYKITDPSTPLLSVWCDAVLRILDKDQVDDKYYKLTQCDQIYWAKYESPFVPPTDKQEAYNIVAHDLNMSVVEITSLEARFRAANTLEQLYIKDVLRLKREIGVTAVIKGELHTVEKKKDPQAKIADFAKIKTEVCRFIQKGKACPYPDCKFTHSIPPKPFKVPTTTTRKPSDTRRPRPIAKTKV